MQQQVIGGAAAVIAGALLAALTAFGIVSTVAGNPSQADQDVVDYGTTQS